jgi:hypothetical protein
VKARFEFKAADCWVGVFWRREAAQTDVWICVVPMLPLHLTWRPGEIGRFIDLWFAAHGWFDS